MDGPVTSYQRPTHEGLPDAGTFTREQTGDHIPGYPAPWEYPVLAVCRTCGHPIRRADGMLAGWQHL